MKPECHICHNKSDYLMNKDGFDEYLCRHCRLSFVWPQPDADWLKNEIYSYESGYQGNKGQDLSINEPDKRARKTLNFLAREKTPGKLLDVGCSNGQFMYWARRIGYGCCGVELNRRTADIAILNGFNVHQGFLDSAPFDRHDFDVVYLGDVIEHVNDPRKFMKTCIDFLKPEGLIIISTPNVDCWWSRTTLAFYRLFGIPWSSATPPHHLFQFNFENLNVLLKEFDLNVIHSVFTVPSSLKYELGSLHLFGRYKREKSLKNLTFMLVSYALYALIYSLNFVLHPLFNKDFQMVVFYQHRL